MVKFLKQFPGAVNIYGNFIKNNSRTPTSRREGYNSLKSITYQITDKNGIHARPAGVIVQCAKRFASEITVEKDGVTANAKKLFALMQLGVKFHDAVTVTAEGTDEEEAVQCLYSVMREAGL